MRTVNQKTTTPNRNGFAVVFPEKELAKEGSPLLRTEKCFRALLEHMAEGFVLYEVIEGEDGKPVDYRFLEMNRVFEKFTGLNHENVLHKLRGGILGGGDPLFTKIYTKVAQSGIPARFIDYSKTLKRYHDVLVFAPEKRCIAVLVNNITEQKWEERAKNNFIAIMAHELRNPLMPIFTNTEILDIYFSEHSHQKRSVDRKIKESVGVIARQAKILGRLLDDLLDISRIILGKITLKKRLMELSQSAQNAIEATMPLIKSQKHSFLFFPAPAPVYINADPVRIEQVITNLLNNAAKYTKPGGQISLTLKKTNAAVLIQVRDNGIGIEPQNINKIFNLFTQLTKPFVETQGNIGIGLKIIKDIVAMHGGTIRVKSDGIGKGSEFTVSLPTASDAPKIQTESPKKDSRVVKRKILIVDDNKDISDSLEHLLVYFGHEVRTAGSGQEALSLAKDFAPQIVLLDIGLPDMPGYDVAKELRETYEEAVKIIALTGYGQEKDKLLAKETGFDYYLTKPISIDDINRVISDAFAGTRAKGKTT
jgi:signal transduction histidine kinase/CheY-like chemotaxis protein